jgi:hypothetical protein
MGLVQIGTMTLARILLWTLGIPWTVAQKVGARFSATFPASRRPSPVRAASIAWPSEEGYLSIVGFPIPAHPFLRLVWLTVLARVFAAPQAPTQPRTARYVDNNAFAASARAF